MYMIFQQNQVSRTVKTVQTNLFANNSKLNKFATCNSNFEKLLLSDMDHLISHILVNFKINRQSFQRYFYRRRTDIASDNIR